MLTPVYYMIIVKFVIYFTLRALQMTDRGIIRQGSAGKDRLYTIYPLKIGAVLKYAHVFKT